MRNLFSGLRFRLLVVVVLGVLPALFLILYSDWEGRQQAAVYAKEKALYLVRQISSNQDDLIEATHHLLIALAKIPEVRQPLRQESPVIFGELRKEFKFYHYCPNVIGIKSTGYRQAPLESGCDLRRGPVK